MNPLQISNSNEKLIFTGVSFIAIIVYIFSKYNGELIFGIENSLLLLTINSIILFYRVFINYSKYQVGEINLNITFPIPGYLLQCYPFSEYSLHLISKC